MKEKIQMGIEDFISHYCKENNINMIWKNPIIKYANANDPKISDLKKIVVDNHFESSDFLENPTTIISYFLPFKEDVAKSNLNGIKVSSVWANAYTTTNEMAIYLNNYLVDMVQSLGYQAS